LSPLSLLTFFAAAKKVSAAPHRGNANKPLTKQGKAKAAKPQPEQKRTAKTKTKTTKNQPAQPKTRDSPQ
jgi:general secretion pathway protein K